MKKISVTFFTYIILILTGSFSLIEPQASLKGGWQIKNGSIEKVLIFQDGYFSFTTYDLTNKKFIQTKGGTYALHGGNLYVKIEFSTSEKESIGREGEYDFVIINDKLTLNIDGSSLPWTRLDDGNGTLAGNWRITGRMNNNEMRQMPGGSRKTLKLLSATRFQWMAINPETKEFFGTGGGTYTFKDGKYTENIEFFSRDSSRVGASLTFDGSVANDVWTHKGLNSRGEPLHEEWTRGKN